YESGYHTEPVGGASAAIRRGCAKLVAYPRPQSAMSAALVQSLRGLQHRLHMARHLHAAPFAAQHAVLVDQEGAAVHAHVFPAVELLQLDHVEQLAQLLLLVGDQLEGKALFGLEVDRKSVV